MSLISYIKARWYRYRSAVTGRFIKKIEAETDKEKSVKEKVEFTQHPDRKKVREILNHYSPIKNEEP